MAQRCLCEPVPLKKLELTKQIYQAWQKGELLLQPVNLDTDVIEPGRPERPRLVEPRYLARRNPGTLLGHAALMHAIAHIEFNAINLAWDAVYRFRDLPADFYQDWIQVASEEAYHFQLVLTYLNSLGYQYGDFDAHNGLWQVAMQTAHDPLLRMALVPRVLEARGLDVTPAMIERLTQFGYPEAASLLQIIYEEEIGHVAIGSRWFRYLCDHRSLNYETEFLRLIQTFANGKLRGPFNLPARQQAGFGPLEIEYLENQS